MVAAADIALHIVELPGHRVNGAILSLMVVVDIKLALRTMTVFALINPAMAHVHCKIVQEGLTGKDRFPPSKFLTVFGLSKVPSPLFHEVEIIANYSCIQ